MTLVLHPCCRVIGGVSGLVVMGSSLTALLLQHPDLQLDQAVSVEALVLPPAAVADFVATEIQLGLKIRGADLGISNRVLFQNVNKTPANRRSLVKALDFHQYFFLENLR